MYGYWSKYTKSKGSPYLIKDNDEKSSCSSQKAQETQLVGDSKACRKVCVEAPRMEEIYSRVACMADPKEQELYIRQQLLLSRSYPGEIESLQCKRYYASINNQQLSTTEQSLHLCIPGSGSALNQRLTNVVKAKKCVIRFALYRVGASTGTVIATPTPILSVIVWRNKIPAAPGTIPSIFALDANPPVSATAMFSGLGIGSGGPTKPLFVRNPVTLLDYHLYHRRDFTLNDEATFDYVTPATGLGIPAPRAWHHQIDVDFHKADVIFSASGSNAPEINDLCVTFVANTDYTNYGFTDQLYVTTDTEFEDVQDDA